MTTVFHRILRCVSDLLKGIPNRLLLLRKFQRDRNTVLQSSSQRFNKYLQTWKPRPRSQQVDCDAKNLSVESPAHAPLSSTERSRLHRARKRAEETRRDAPAALPAVSAPRPKLLAPHILRHFVERPDHLRVPEVPGGGMPAPTKSDAASCRLLGTERACQCSPHRGA
jgi:hypothetical protein